MQKQEVPAFSVLEVYERLDTMHAWRGWHWWPDGEPFEVIVGCILVQNTAWTNVERALQRLRAANALNPAVIDTLSQEELEVLVKPSGQYRQKARKLRAFLDLARRHGGLDALLAIPARELRPLLLATFGIGPETADAIICYGAKQRAFVIDAYTMRVFTRLGIGPISSANYDDWQRFFLDNLRDSAGGDQRDLFARYHALIVLHAKHLCRKRAPRCGECLLASGCLAAHSDLPD
jgi:endonuclease-3 related protein